MQEFKDKKTFWFMALILWLFWIAISASYHYQGLLLGAVLALLITRFNHDLLFKREERPLLDAQTLILFLRYALHLIGAVVVASLQVAYLVMHPALPISPGMVRFPISLKKDLNKVLLANSITLTPGTLTVLVEEGEIVVHALTKENAREVVHWPLAAELAATEKEQEDN